MAAKTRWAIASLLIAAACGQARGANDSTGDVLFLRSGNDVAVVEAGARAPSFSGEATPSGDWSTVVRSGIHRGTTTLVASDPRSGARLWEQDLDGRYVVKLVSAASDTVVLAPADQTHYNAGRRRTRLVIAGPAREVRPLTLDGNYEPEAVSVDGSTLFVIRYLPALRPDRYQVRQVDVASGEVGAVYTPDAELQQSMGGTARVQAASADGTRLYTLYTLEDGHSEHAFIHTLALDELWAHCIDLPAGFTTDARTATGLALSPDGDRLYVANSSIGRLAEIDTDTLQVVRTAPLDIDHFGPTTAVHDGASTLYVTSGSSLVTVDLESLTQTASWLLDDAVRGLQVAAEAGRVYVGHRDEVSVVDAATGEELDTIDPPGLQSIGELGPVFPEVHPGRRLIKCAC